MSKSDAIFNQFIAASKQIAADLEVDCEILYDREEWSPGFFYEASVITGRKTFSFWFREEFRNERCEKTACLEIDFNEGAAPFYMQEEIDYIHGHSDYLNRWAAWAVFNFNQKHNKTILNSIFSESVIRVYGTPGYCWPAEGEAKLLFNGIMAIQKQQLLVYRFRHVEPPNGYLCRSISYAIWVIGDGHPFWVVIPDSCGLDSGGGHATFTEIEHLIGLVKAKIGVEIRNVDLPYEELETYLLRHSEGFSSILRDTDLFDFFFYDGPYNVLSGEKQFDRFKERFHSKEYPEALRDLRAMVQQAEENLLKAKSVDASTIQDSDVNKLAALLIDKKIIDGRLRSWFSAFTSVANLASHKNYPTPEDMKEGAVRTRILLTFQLGFQLLEELDNPLREKIIPKNLTIKIGE